MADQNEDIKKTETKEQQQPAEDIDALDNAFDDEEDKDPLNITADERSQADEDELDPQFKEQYEHFMKGMQGDGAQGMQFLNEMMGQMFSGLNINPNGQQGNPTGPSQQQNPFSAAGGQGPDFSAFQNQFGDMFKNFEDNPEYDALANHLLQEFMDKDILEEPLFDSQKKYKEYLEENKDKLSAEDKTRYENQQKCIDELIKIVQQEPNNKDKMIAKFEEMQEYGQPPEPLINAFGGDSPFAAFTQPQNQQAGKQNVPPNMMGGGAPGEECRIF